MSLDPIRGRCFCGEITFALTPPTESFTHCHCESCRRSHGAAFVSWTSVGGERFRCEDLGGNLRGYESSPDIIWQFCGRCGAPLFQTTHYSPGIVYIVAAALIDPLDRPAESHVSWEERVHWLEVQDALPKRREKTSDRIG